MKHKDHLAKTSKGLIKKFNQTLKKRGIATKEMPFFIKKVQFGLQEAPSGPTERKCIQWDSKLVQRTNPTTGEKYWQLEDYCVKFADDEDF